MPEDVKDAEDSSASEDKTVPYKRFKEKVDEVNIKEQELQTLKSQTPGALTPEQQKEAQAKTFLKGLVKEQLQEEAEAEKAATAKEQKKFESDVDDVIAINTKVDKAEFLKFIEKDADKYGITSVKGAMKLYKDLNKIKDDTVEQTKENLAAKPKLPKSKGAADTTIDYAEEDKDKTYEQVVQEIHKEAEELESRK